MDWLTAVTALVAAALAYVAGGGVTWLTTRGRIRQRLAADVAVYSDMPDVPEKVMIQELIQKHVRQLASEDSPEAKKERREIGAAIFVIYVGGSLLWDAIATPYPIRPLVVTMVSTVFSLFVVMSTFLHAGRARAGRLDAAARGEPWVHPGSDDPPDRLARWGMRKQEEKERKREEKRQRRQDRDREREGAAA